METQLKTVEWLFEVWTVPRQVDTDEAKMFEFWDFVLEAFDWFSILKRMNLKKELIRI